MMSIETKNDELILLRQMDPSWHEFMRPILLSKEFQHIFMHLRIDATKLAPHPSRVFRVLKMPMDQIRVIIVGQDPHINGEAEGFAFSSQKGMTPSLREIFKEIALTEGNYRTNPSLHDWVRQGVFLINTNLTTIERKSLAHDKIGWPFVTKQILKHISDTKKEPLVVMAWGNHAKVTVRETITKSPDRLILQHTHPAARFQNFTGNNHFKDANEFLVSKGLTPINWVGQGSTTVD